jgi:hypothetical protein
MVVTMIQPDDDIFATEDWSEPPKNMSKPLQALWLIRKGGYRVGPEWEQAHAIVQAQEGVFEFDWVHALLHWIEADMGNADYWYRRAGRKRATPSVSAEWQHMASELSGVTKH